MLQKPSHTEAFLTKKQTSLISSIISQPSSRADEPQKTRKQAKMAKDSYWSQREQQIYLNTLKEHMPMIMSTEYRRKNRIFKEIALSLRTRTAVQVKSHHQKLEEKLMTIPKIIEYLQRWLKDTENHLKVPAQAKQPASKKKQGNVMVDACIQTDSPFCHEIFFQPEYLENYIQSLVSFKNEFLISK